MAENDQAKEVQVTLGYQTDEWVEITSPQLPEGAKVVTSGQSKLAEGSAIRIRTAEEVAREQGLDGNSKVVSQKHAETSASVAPQDPAAEPSPGVNAR